MARPRKHQTEEQERQAHAAAQARYRRRLVEGTVPVDRAALEELVAAVEEAAAAGDPIARLVRGGTADALVRNLARWFQQRAAGERDT